MTFTQAFADAAEHEATDSDPYWSIKGPEDRDGLYEVKLYTKSDLT